MHISLDSALGRQRRLNSVGESVLQIAPNAAAAYSLRSLTGGDPKVVRVRRDTDNAEQDFTASGVSSGALVDFATSGNGVFANTGYESFTNASASGFTASNTGSTGFAVSDILDGVSGDAVSVSFDIDITNGSPGISLRTALNGGSTASNGIVYTTSGSKTATLTGNKGYVGVGFTEGDAPSNFTVSNFKVLGNGFVETWYDQSGNGRDSTQTTAARQPIIVESGTFQDGLKFTHTDTTNGKRMYVPRNTPELGTEFALAWVGTYSGSEAKTKVVLGNARGVQTNNSGAVAIMVRPSSNAFRFINENSGTSTLSSINTTTVAADTTAVVFANFDDDAVTISTDGNVHTSTLSGTSLTSTADLRIMAAQSASGATGGSYRTTESTEGICKEVLVYDTNQSNNRTSIETNIINHYSIS